MSPHKKFMPFVRHQTYPIAYRLKSTHFATECGKMWQPAATGKNDNHLIKVT
jgi:hypothetical protein